MTFLPIVERELRNRARRKSAWRFRLGGAVVAIAIVSGLLVLDAGFTPAFFRPGAFVTVGWLAFAFCLLEGVRNAADCLSEEKRAGTLGLLFLTDLKGYDVVLGKLAATSLNSFYALLAIFPPLAIPLFLGGVTVGEFWRLLLVLLVTLFFSLTTGLLVSSASWRARKTWTAAVLIIFIFAFVPPLLWSIPAWQGSWPASVGPTMALLGLFHGVYRPHPEYYWAAVGSTHLLSWIFLAAACQILPRAWQESPQAEPNTGSRWKKRLFGKCVPRRQALVNLAPARWLAERHQEKGYLIWLLMLVAGGAMISSCARGGGSAQVGLLLFITGLALHLGLTFWVAFQACHTFTEARESGALEILLSTPLSVNEILTGHVAALKRLFYRPILTLVFSELILLAAQLFLMASNGSAVSVGVLICVPICLTMVVAVMDLYAVAHFGLWMGLKTKKPSQALTRTLLYVLLLPLCTAFCCVLVWPVMGIVKNLFFINYSRGQLQKHFRALVTERFAAGRAEGIAPVAAPLARRSDLPPVLPR